MRNQIDDCQDWDLGLSNAHNDLDLDRELEMGVRRNTRSSSSSDEQHASFHYRSKPNQSKSNPHSLNSLLDKQQKDQDDARAQAPRHFWTRSPKKERLDDDDDDNNFAWRPHHARHLSAEGHQAMTQARSKQLHAGVNEFDKPDEQYGMHHLLGLAKTAEREPEHKRPAEWRLKLGHFIESKRFAWAMLALLACDVVLVFFELLLLEDVFGESQHVHRVEHALHWCSMAILFTFAAELVLLLVAFGWRFFTHWGYVLDLVIIPTSIVLELLFEASGGVLVIIRMWRVVRIAHGVFEAKHEDDAMRKRKMKALLDKIAAQDRAVTAQVKCMEEEKEHMWKQWREMKEQSEHSEAELERLKRENADKDKWIEEVRNLLRSHGIEPLALPEKSSSLGFASSSPSYSRERTRTSPKSEPSLPSPSRPMSSPSTSSSGHGQAASPRSPASLSSNRSHHPDHDAELEQALQDEQDAIDQLNQLLGEVEPEDEREAAAKEKGDTK